MLAVVVAYGLLQETHGVHTWDESATGCVDPLARWSN